MPLMPGNIVGYDNLMMVFRFTMMASDARTIACEVSSKAMDFIARSRGTLPSERESQFSMLRDQIERVASAIFDREGSSVIRIFAKHVEIKKRRRRRQQGA